MAERSRKIANCIVCGVEFKPWYASAATYCSNKCQGELKQRTLIEKWLKGEYKGWLGVTRQLAAPIRLWLKQSRGSACCKCGWDLKHPIDGKSLTEINHIDGNAENSIPENLEILCPNCHSMTVNYKTRNKGSKRNKKNQACVA